MLICMPGRPAKRLLPVGLVWLWGCAGGGAEPGAFDRMPPDPGGEAEVSGDDHAAWPFWPRRLRIHPLSQLVTDRESGRLLIEVRLEFFDRLGHTSKAVGQVLIDLLAGERGGDPIVTWAKDLSAVEANREHYDDLTRTYLFRLEFDPGLLPEDPELRAYFRSSDGRALQAQPYRLRR